MFVEEEFKYDYCFGYCLYFKQWDKSRDRFYDITNVNSQIEILNISHEEFCKIVIEEFNGKETTDLTNFKWRHCVKFDDEDDCRKCIEYLNGLLIMNKLWR